MHIKDLKTGAGKSGSHAVSGPEVGGGHRMGKASPSVPSKNPIRRVPPGATQRPNSPSAN